GSCRGCRRGGGVRQRAPGRSSWRWSSGLRPGGRLGRARRGPPRVGEPARITRPGGTGPARPNRSNGASGSADRPLDQGRDPRLHLGRELLQGEGGGPHRPVVEGRVVVEAERRVARAELRRRLDRKSTRLNSSHVKISYAVF